MSKTTNNRVKKQIIDAFFTLLRKKTFSEITITDIVTEAKVSRASYYRNYNSKEAIIENALDNLRDEILKDVDYSDDAHIFKKENVLFRLSRAFTLCFSMKSDLLTLYNNGFGNLIQQVFNRYVIEFAGNMPASSIERYKLYFLSGATVNILYEWIVEGAKESPEEIAEICVRCMEGGLLI